MPAAVVLFEFYRERAGRLAVLERAKKREPLTFEEKSELKELVALLRTPEPPFSIASLLQSEDAEVTSDDPMWERYKKAATSQNPNDIPDSWWGTGEAGKKLKEVAMAKWRERMKGA